MRNEQLCELIQRGDNEKDTFLILLVQQNSEVFRHWVFDEFARALDRKAAIDPDELMAEALAGFRRAAEKYNTTDETVDYIEYAEYWVRARVRSYVKKAERGSLPDRMLPSIKEYQHLLNVVRNGEDRTSITKEQAKEIIRAVMLLAGGSESEGVAYGY